MNEIKPIEHLFQVGGDFFALMNINRSKRKLSDYLPLFNIDDYYIYKYTRHQKEVSIKEFLEFKHCGYTFHKKDKYDKKDLEKLFMEVIKHE